MILERRVQDKVVRECAKLVLTIFDDEVAKCAHVVLIPRTMPAVIHISIREADGSSTRHTALPGEYFFGRDPKCEFVLHSAEVSRRHARMKFDEGAFEIEDLGSTSGTVVQGRPLTRVLRLRYPQDIEVGGVQVSISNAEQEVPAHEEPPSAEDLPAAGDDEVTISIVMDATRPGDLPLNGLSDALAKRVALLVELPLQFAAESDLAELHGLILARVMALTPRAKRGALLLPDDDGKFSVHLSQPDSHPALSRSLVQRAVREQRGFIWHGEKDEAGIYVPMVWQGEVVGVIFVDDPERADAFRSEDLQLLIAAARSAAAAMVAR